MHRQILANIALETPNLELWFSWIGQEDGETDTGWKLHDIRLAEVDRELEWFESISEANAHFHDRNSISVRMSYLQFPFYYYYFGFLNIDMQLASKFCGDGPRAGFR